MLEPLLMMAGLAVLLYSTGCAVAVATAVPFGIEIAAAVAYTSWTIVVLFYPGRGNPGYNPFGAVARRVWKPLLRLHLIGLAVLLPASAVWAYLVRRFAPPHWFYVVSIVVVLILSLWQSIPSADLLSQSAEKQRETAS